MEIKDLENILTQAFPQAANIQVENPQQDGKHFQITIKSAQFNELGLLKQHQLVYNHLQPYLDNNEIHAVQLTTLKQDV